MKDYLIDLIESLATIWFVVWMYDEIPIFTFICIWTIALTGFFINGHLSKKMLIIVWIIFFTSLWSF